VVAFPGNHCHGNIAPEVEKLVSSGTARILDLVFVGKDEAGDTISIEVDELAAFGEIDGEVGGLVNMEGLDLVADNLPEGNSALVIVWEDLWGKPLVEAMRESGGVVVESARITAALVGEALNEVAAAINEHMPMRRRPVMRTVARTAVIAGTVTAVAGWVARHQDTSMRSRTTPGLRPRRTPPPTNRSRSSRSWRCSRTRAS
jgi:Family of unknown function (DUF6325)